MKKYFCIIITVFCLLFLVLNKAGAPALKSQASHKDLKEHYNKVLAFWQDKLKADPYSFIARKKIASTKMNLARASGNEQLYREAEEILINASQFAPGKITDEEYHVLMAAALMSRHQFAQAINVIDAKLEASPNNLLLQLSRGDALCGLGKYEECAALFQKLADEKPGYDTWVRLAQALEAMGKDLEAIELIERAESKTKHLSPENEAWIKVRLASLHLKENNLTAAEKHLVSALEFYPEYYLAQEHLAEVYEKRMEWEQAKIWLEKALKNKEDPHFLIRLAKISEHTGEPQNSIKLINKARTILEELYIKEPGAHARDLAEILISQGDSTRSVELVKVDLALRPDDIKTNLTAAQAYRISGDIQMAKKYIDKAVRYSSSIQELALEKNLIYSKLS